MSMLVARDAAAADQLVYPYPFSVGPSIDVSCGNDEVVVLCPAWAVGGMLGPGRHQWQSPEPGKPLAVYFVLTGPVDVDFDMVCQFALPSTGMPLTIRASGSALVRVADPGMLIAQFVGLPFDRVNDGLKASVATSVERLLGKVLPRKIVLAGTPSVVTDPSMRSTLVDELTSYNPGIGAVYGLQFVRFVSLEIAQVGPDLQPLDGWLNAKSSPGIAPPPEAAGWVAGREPTGPGVAQTEVSGWIGGHAPSPPAAPPTEASGWIGGREPTGTGAPPAEASGWIGGREPTGSGAPALEVSGWIGGREPTGSGAALTEVSGWIGGGDDDATEEPTAKQATTPAPAPEATATPAPAAPSEPAVLAAGTPVLVSMADGLLHAATIRQAMQGYYELDIGGSDKPMWVAQHQVTPQL